MADVETDSAGVGTAVIDIAEQYPGIPIWEANAAIEEKMLRDQMLSERMETVSDSDMPMAEEADEFTGGQEAVVKEIAEDASVPEKVVEPKLDENSAMMGEIAALRAAMAKQGDFMQSVVDQNKVLTAMLASKPAAETVKDLPTVSITDMKAAMDAEFVPGFADKTEKLIVSIMEQKLKPLYDNLNGINTNAAQTKQQVFEGALAQAGVNFGQYAESPEFHEFVGAKRNGVLYRSLVHSLTSQDLSGVKDIVRAFEASKTRAAVVAEEDTNVKKDLKGGGKEPIYGDKKAAATPVSTRDVTDADIEAAEKRYRFADAGSKQARYDELIEMTQRQIAQAIKSSRGSE